MEEKQLGKATYKLLVVWFMCWLTLEVIATVAVTYYADVLGTDATVKVTGIIIGLAMVVLMKMVEHTECIYWVTGMSYREAAEATSERRKAYATKHLRRFAIGATLFILYSCIGWFADTSVGIDLIALVGILGGTGISTINIKL